MGIIFVPRDSDNGKLKGMTVMNDERHELGMYIGFLPRSMNFFYSETHRDITKEQRKKLFEIELNFVYDESPSEIYGKYSTEEINKDIKELLDSIRGKSGAEREQLKRIEELFEAISKRLDENKPWDEELNGLIRCISDIIEGCRGLKRKIKSIQKKTAKRQRRFLTLGQFDAEKWEIRFYMKNIDTVYHLKNLEESDVNDIFNSLLAHEYFHAFHYIQMTDKRKWTYDDEKSITVVESLAKYIEYRYCVKYGIGNMMRDDIRDMWGRFTMDEFPYAGAKHIDRFPNLCELMFKESIMHGNKSAYHLIKTASQIE